MFINDLDGYVVAINPAACRLHGYSRDEFIGLHRTAYIHPSCHHLLPAYVRTITAGGLGVQTPSHQHDRYRAQRGGDMGAVATGV